MENIVVIPHAFSSKKVENVSRNLNDIIVITRLAEKKNFDLVLEIQKAIQARNLDFQMNVYGKVATEKGYQEVLKKIMDENLRVNIKGSINNIENEIAKSCCTLVTSIAEGQVMCLYESLSVKTPVIVSDFKYGQKDVVHNGLNGFVISLEFNKEEYISKFVDKIVECQRSHVNNTWNSDNFKLDNFEEKNLFNILEKEIIIGK